ncbi:hypothetical protein [Bradyrhizobium sp. AUGA SZCCT0160]|uniref:hypothetical protein n=1 Tax=Bradyrhizobium sp. AUGA SZCCT0160 TaxID=2807662 RepID=UPI00201265B8|nr:hypothetical protein [Bradyrhizobium sp. AUGA SZCCT0160]
MLIRSDDRFGLPFGFDDFLRCSVGLDYAGLKLLPCFEGDIDRAVPWKQPGIFDRHITRTHIMTAPVASIGNRSMLSNHWQRLQPWISYSDADGNPAVSYQFFDSGTSATSGYFWTPTNAIGPPAPRLTFRRRNSPMSGCVPVRPAAARQCGYARSTE